MSEASSVGFASLLICALALSAPASAASIFQRGAAQYASDVSDGQFKVNGKVNDNGTESFLCHLPVAAEIAVFGRKPHGRNVEV